MSNFGNYSNNNGYGNGYGNNNSYGYSNNNGYGSSYGQQAQQAIPVPQDDADWDYMVEDDVDPYTSGSTRTTLAPGIYDYVVKKVSRDVCQRPGKLQGCKLYEITFGILDRNGHELSEIKENVYFGPQAKAANMDWLAGKYLAGFKLKEPGKPANLADLLTVKDKTGKVVVTAQGTANGRRLYINNQKDFEAAINDGVRLFNTIDCFVKG